MEKQSEPVLVGCLTIVRCASFMGAYAVAMRYKENKKSADMKVSGVLAQKFGWSYEAVRLLQRELARADVESNKWHQQ